MFLKAVISNLAAVAAGVCISFLHPSSAVADSGCEQSLGRNGDERAQAISEVPALAHLTTVRGLVGIIRSGKIKPYSSVRGLLKNKAIGGADESVFLAPLFKPVDVRTGMPDITGPTLIVAPHVLWREDYFYNLDNWEGYGGFDRYLRNSKEGGSYLPHELTPERSRRMKEIMFANPIDVEADVVAIWIPAWQRAAFETLLMATGYLLKPDVPIFSGAQLPDIKSVRRFVGGKNRKKKFSSELLLPHPIVPQDLLDSQLKRSSNQLKRTVRRL